MSVVYTSNETIKQTSCSAVNNIVSVNNVMSMTVRDFKTQKKYQVQQYTPIWFFKFRWLHSSQLVGTSRRKTSLLWCTTDISAAALGE